MTVHRFYLSDRVTFSRPNAEGDEYCSYIPPFFSNSSLQSAHERDRFLIAFLKGNVAHELIKLQKSAPKFIKQDKINEAIRFSRP
jgi:hypothetical protein